MSQPRQFWLHAPFHLDRLLTDRYSGRVVTTAPVATQQSACTALVYRQGQLRDDVPLTDIDRALLDEGCVVWLDVERPSEAEFQLLAEEFQLHPLAVEDIHRAHQRPKLDVYDDLRLIVLFDAQVRPDRRRLVLHEVDVFIGRNFMITVHRAPVPAIADLIQRWKRQPNMVEPNPLGLLLYQLANSLVDGYFPLADALQARIEEIEERIFEGFDRRVLREIFTLRRGLIQMRRILGPERDVFVQLAHRDESLFDPGMAPYFSDVVDLLLRLIDTVDSMRDLLSAALESYLTIQSNNLNEIMKRLTALTVTLMVPTLIAGIYGMNFQLTPSNEWIGGFWFAVAAMLVLSVATLAWFRYRDWL
jgi:magnesium transporter